MKSYIAHDKSDGDVYGGGLHACLQWAFDRIQKRRNAVINILIVRHKSPARVIAEVDRTGGRWIFGGRTVSASQLSKLLRRVQYG